MSDRLKASVEAIVEAIVGRRVDRSALYPARVVAQAADGTLEVMLDDTRFASMTKVRLRTFAPEVSIEVQPGARVLVGWEGGRPDSPYASLWESDGSLVKVTIGDAAAAQFAALANLVKARLDTIQSTFDTHTHPVSGSATSAPSALIGTLGDVAATKLKVE